MYHCRRKRCVIEKCRYYTRFEIKRCRLIVHNVCSSCSVGHVTVSVFSILEEDILIEPAEVFDLFVEIQDDLTLDKGSFLALKSRASEL